MQIASNDKAVLYIVTSQQFHQLTFDDQLLFNQLTAECSDHLTVKIAVWDSMLLEKVESGGYKSAAILIRTPWDYTFKYEAFLEWVKRIPKTVACFNHADAIVWNSHKRYLVQLAHSCVPVVPTAICTSVEQVRQFASKQRLELVVVKPAVGSFGNSVHSTSLSNLHSQAHKKQLQQMIDCTATGEVLVQPFISSVKSRGEISLVFVDELFTHAVKKVPPHGDFKVQGGKVALYETPTKKELSVALHALRECKKIVFGGEQEQILLYSRVDLLYSSNGDDECLVSELEILDPELFFKYSDKALHAMVQAIRRQVLQSIK